MGKAAAVVDNEFDWHDPDYVQILQVREERLRAIRDDPELLAAALMHYKHSPDGVIDFIEDWMFTFDPRLEGIKTVPFVLWEKQREYLRWLKELYDSRNDGLVEKSRDQGATWMNMGFAVWLWRFHDTVKVSFGSRKEMLVDRLGDPDSIFEKGRTILENLPEEMLPPSFNIEVHAPHLKIINPDNNSTITGEAGDQIGRGGRSSIYFKDESAFYERPEKIDSALSQNSDVKIDVSTPNGPGNPFYQKRHSGKLPVFTLHWRDDPRKDEAWYKDQCNKLDEIIVAQEIDIDYHASQEGACIPAKWIKAAVEFKIKASGMKRAGLDVADEGGDDNVLITGQGPVIQSIEDWKKGNTTQTARRAYADCKIRDIEALNYDSIGVGAGVKGELAELILKNKKAKGKSKYVLKVHPINTGNKPTRGEYSKGKKNVDMFINYRAQIWWELRRRFERTWEHVNGVKKHHPDKMISIPNHAQLIAELSQPRREINEAGKIKIESKKRMLGRGVKSPNFADALVLFFADKGILSSTTMLLANKGRR